MEPTRLRLGELLVDARIITPEQLTEVLEVQKADGRRLGILLVERGLVNETQLTQILSQQLSVPWVSLYHVDFSKRLLSMVPRDVAAKYCLVPIYVRHVRGQGDTLYVAMYDPTNVEALRICAAWSGLPTRAMIASPSDIRNAIDVYYGAEPDQQAADPEASADQEQPTGEASAAEEQPGEAASSADEQPEAPDGSSVAVSPEQAPVEERFAGETHAETGEPALPTEPPGQELPSTDAESPPEAQADEAPAAEAADAAEPEAVEPSPAEDAQRYDDSVSVEVGREVPLDELLARRPAPEPPADGGQEAPAAPRAKSARMLALTLLDGTTLALPMNRQATKPRRESLIKALRSTQEGQPAPDAPPPQPASHPPPAPPSSRPPSLEPPPSDVGPTAREVIAALRAAVQGEDPAAVLGSNARWESMIAAVLSLMLRKGLITDEELAEELKKI